MGPDLKSSGMSAPRAQTATIVTARNAAAAVFNGCIMASFANGGWYVSECPERNGEANSVTLRCRGATRYFRSHEAIGGWAMTHCAWAIVTWCCIVPLMTAA